MASTPGEIEPAWLVVPHAIEESSCEAFDERTLDVWHERLRACAGARTPSRDFASAVGTLGAHTVARAMIFGDEETRSVPTSPDALPDMEEAKYWDDDAQYLAMHAQQIETALRECEQVDRLARPDGWCASEADEAVQRYRRWAAQNILHLAEPERWPAPRSPVLRLTLQGLRERLQLPVWWLNDAWIDLVAQALRDGGVYPDEVTSGPRWGRELLYAVIDEVRWTDPGAWDPRRKAGLAYPSVQVRVYASPRLANLPSEAFTTTAEWLCDQARTWENILPFGYEPRPVGEAG